MPAQECKDRVTGFNKTLFSLILRNGMFYFEYSQGGFMMKHTVLWKIEGIIKCDLVECSQRSVSELMLCMYCF